MADTVEEVLVENLTCSWALNSEIRLDMEQAGVKGDKAGVGGSGDSFPKNLSSNSLSLASRSSTVVSCN